MWLVLLWGIDGLVGGPTFGSDAVLLIPQIARRDWWMMADLLGDQFRLFALLARLTDEDLAQERIQRLLDTIRWIPASELLIFEGGEEPFQYGKNARFRVWESRSREEERRVRDPESREFRCRCWSEHEGWSGDVGEVAFDCCY